MTIIKAFRRCLFPELSFRWYSRIVPDDLRARLHSIKPLLDVQPSFRRIGEGYNVLYLWVGMDESDYRMVARRLVPATSPELRITGSISAHGQGSIMAGTIKGGLTEQIIWAFVRLAVLLSVTSWLLKNLFVQGSKHHLDASAFIAWGVCIAAVAAAPFVQFSFLCGTLLPKVKGRFSAIDYPVKR